MVRIPSAHRRTEPDGRDNDRDGLVDERDERTTDEDRPVFDGRHRSYPGDDVDHDVSRDITDRDGDGHPDSDRDRYVDTDRDRYVEDDHEVTGRGHAPVVPVGEVIDRDTDVVAVPPAQVARPRASGLATLSLIFGLAGALLVLTGQLAALGVAAGVLGLVFAVGGLSATGRPHVAGRLDATLGMLLSLGAVIVGLLAINDMLSWLDTDTNYVASFNDWLVDRLPWLDRF
ncbi:MAG TPA: hypothetical protein VFM55_09925 [Micromonosporaceae bacterium]|nr:hypothetical protein [Micromonosporaceae bacterium]